MKKILIAAALVVAAVLSAGCASDADVASENLSKAAEQFEVNRRVVFFNGITDTYLLSIEGRCSIEDQGDQLEVTCKTAADRYNKQYLGLSDNVSYFVEQLDDVNVDAYHYRVIFKPETIIPDPDLETSGD